MKYLLSSTALFLALIFNSCGGEAPKETTDASAETANTETSTTPSKKEISVEVVGNSMADMAYSPTLLTLVAGDTVSLTLVNKNSAEGMLHNILFVNLGKGQDIATAAIEAGPDKAYVPDSPDVIAASGLAKPNETISMEFIAPAAGTYNFICTYPGHFPKMIGKLIVK